MRIKRVFVKRLFNLFDHDINMKMDDRITIVHAPNGFGKTAILRMISGLFQDGTPSYAAFHLPCLALSSKTVGL